MATVNISIIITAHNEGLLLYKTILSVLKATDKLDNDKVTYDITLSLDNADDQTKKIAEKYQNNSRFNILEVNFGNPADNRNNAIKQARGEFVALLDGDDLVSENWLASSLSLIKKQKNPSIMRLEIHAQFGYDEKNMTIWKMRSSSSKETDAIQMAYWNLWTNTLFAKKETLLETPFEAPKNGFGFEDYLFGTQTRAKNVDHVVVPETALFYRRRPGSVSADHVGTILGYSDLFNISYFKSIQLSNESNKKSTSAARLKRITKRGYRFAFDTAKKIGPVNRLISPAARKILYKNKVQKIPGWFIDEWKKINKIENQLWPTEGEIAKLQFHPLTFDPFNKDYGVIYQKLCHELSDDHLDYLFLAPHMSGNGGTEKLISNYIKAIQKNHRLKRQCRLRLNQPSGDR